MTVSQGPERLISTSSPQAVRRTVGTNIKSPVRKLRIAPKHWMPVSVLAVIMPLIAMTLTGAKVDGEPQSVSAPSSAIELSLPSVPLATSSVPKTDATSAHAQSRTVRIEAGQTMGQVFEALALPSNTLHQLLEYQGARDRLSKIRAGDEFVFATDETGALKSLQFERGENERVVLHLEEGGIREETQSRAIQTRVLVASGEIRDNLVAAGESAGMSYTAILELAKAFSYDIDFSQDLRVGDRFDVVYEEVWRDGERLRSGDVLAATFINQGKSHQVFRYQFADGSTDYFDADGRPMKKGFLRMPVDFARISSGFSTARKHPILGRTRAHQGVDYAASTGTQIMSAGDGKITFAGWKGGYGRTVIIQHANNVSTLYGHMSRFGSYKTGSRVRQGDVIGYIGSSGLATGPHLHYEFRIAGVHRDPLKVTMPKPEPLPKSELQRFRLQTQPLLAQLNLRAGGKHYATAGDSRRRSGP